MSNFLAIDTSSRYLTVLAQKGERQVLRHYADCAMKHSVILMDEIDAVLREAQLKPEECDFFAAVTGPGSFTGIRIGIATVKGFALATGKPVLGVTAFDLIAYNVADENFCVVIDAGRNNYYLCSYPNEPQEYCYLSEEEVKKLNKKLYGFEDLPFENYTKLDVKNCLHPAICLNKRNFSKNIQALYVRKSQAEEMRERRQSSGADGGTK